MDKAILKNTLENILSFKLSDNYSIEFLQEVLYSYIQNTRLSEDKLEFLINELPDLSWDDIKYQKLSDNFLRKISNKIDWDEIHLFQKLSEEFIIEFQDKIDWYQICTRKKFSEDFIRKFKTKFSLCNVYRYQKLSEDLILELEPSSSLSWHDISRFQKLSEDFIRNYQDKVNWSNISSYQNISKKFILEFLSKIDVEKLLLNNNISNELKETIKLLK